MKFIKHHCPLFLILLITGFLRLYQLGNVPPSPSLDEVSIGYNAYSILRTGKDEYGNFLPILLRAYDDWRPALYVYLVIPFVKTLGLSALAVRLPAALLSVSAVLFVYLLGKELFNDKKYEIKIKNIKFDLAFVSTLMLTISPWHLYISRLGHEVNLGWSLFMSAIYFFILSIRRDPKRYWLIVSAALFSLTFYTYQSFKIITPLFIVLLTILYRKKLLNNIPVWLVSLFIFILIAFPIGLTSLSPAALIRIQGTSIFVNNPLFYAKTDALWLRARINGDPVGSFLYDPKITSTRIFVVNYLLHFDPVWLLRGKSYEKFKVPGLGLFYIWELPLILLGLVGFWLWPIDRKIKTLVVFWLFSGPLPAAVSTETPHAMRSFTALPSIQILTGLGLFWIIEAIKSKKAMILSFWLVLVLVSTIYLYNQYFKVFPRAHSGAYQYGLNQAFPYVLSQEANYQKIIVSDEKNLYQSYMFYLYWSRFDPESYLKQGGTKSGGFAQIHLIGKYVFRPINWKDERPQKGSLYVGNPDDFPQGLGALKTFNSLDNTPAVKLIAF